MPARFPPSFAQYLEALVKILTVRGLPRDDALWLVSQDEIVELAQTAYGIRNTPLQCYAALAAGVVNGWVTSERRKAKEEQELSAATVSGTPLSARRRRLATRSRDALLQQLRAAQDGPQEAALRKRIADLEALLAQPHPCGPVLDGGPHLPDVAADPDVEYRKPEEDAPGFPFGQTIAPPDRMTPGAKRILGCICGNEWSPGCPVHSR